MPEKEVVAYQVVKEGKENLLKVDATSWSYLPNIEDNGIVMANVIDQLAQNPSITKIVFLQRRNYTYDYEQVQILAEIASLYNHLIKQKKVLSFINFKAENEQDQSVVVWYNNLQNLLLNLLKIDPVGAYVEVKRLIRLEKLKENKKSDFPGTENFYLRTLNYIHTMLEKTKMINMVKDYVAGHVVGSRMIYRNVLRPTITPDFMFTQIMINPPLNGEELDNYSLDSETEVSIFRVPGDIKYLYHLSPPEFKLSEEKYSLLDLAKNILSEHKPLKEEFVDPERMRQTFFNVGRDLLIELAQHKNISIDFDESEKLANILVRYTVGFGLIETLLKDKKVQDINVNGPIGNTSIFIVHEDYGECVTNIIPSEDDGESWATKLRLSSGRPLDEANPILDTDLLLPYARARVAVISRPLNPHGLAYTLRRHRDKPWTLPLFINNKMMNAQASGLLSFLIDGARTLLIAGTRSSGKTSILGSILVEVMRKYRIITVEDTLELPTDYLRKLGYNIQSLKVRSALTSGGAEISADEGIRTSLRMGDSSLIIGEIRSKEAQALYEAMRIGALANVVAGTIHGASPYAVFDRVVNDLDVPRTSFKATDIILVANPIKTPDGLNQVRRVLQIAEVRKHWEEDPLREKGFVDLMTYDTKTDQLKPSQDLINGDSEVLKSIASNVKEWAGNWDAIWENIILRTKIKQTLVDYANTSKINDLLEAKFVVASNDKFHQLCQDIKEEIGYISPERVFKDWDFWIKSIIKKRELG